MVGYGRLNNFKKESVKDFQLPPLPTFRLSKNRLFYLVNHTHDASQIHSQIPHPLALPYQRQTMQLPLVRLLDFLSNTLVS